MAQICPKYARFTSHMHQFYVFNTPVMSLFRRFTSLECYKHVLVCLISSSRCPVMCLFRAVLRRKNVTNASLMRLSSTRPVIYRFRVILRRKYSLNTPVLWCYTPEIRAFLRRRCAANALQIARFLTAFCPLSARISPAICL